MKTQKKSIETILLLLIFVFGAIGFWYAFNHRDQAKPEKVVLEQHRNFNKTR